MDGKEESKYTNENFLFTKNTNLIVNNMQKKIHVCFEHKFVKISQFAVQILRSNTKKQTNTLKSRWQKHSFLSSGTNAIKLPYPEKNIICDYTGKYSN